MSADDTKSQGVVLEAAKALGIGTVVPEAYRDLLQPAAKEVGGQLLLVAKAVKIALTPLAATVWSYERLSDWLQVRLTAHLANIPAERIVAPRPEIAGPLLLHLHFLKDEEELRNLFSNLLAAAMDRETRDRIHPAYVSVLQQLAPDEALIIRYLDRAEQEAAVRAEEKRLEGEERKRRIAEHLAAGKDRESILTDLLKPLVFSAGFWCISDIWPRNEGEPLESLESQFTDLCRAAGARLVDQSEAYLDNLIRLRIVVYHYHSTAELEPEGGDSSGYWGAHIREGSTRELFLSEFGKRLVKSVCRKEGDDDRSK